MARKKKKKGKKKVKTHPSARLLEVKAITDHLETKIKVEAECYFCYEDANDEDENVRAAADAKMDHASWMYKQGWREVESNEYQVTALACPTCARKKDEDR